MSQDKTTARPQTLTRYRYFPYQIVFHRTAASSEKAYSPVIIPTLLPSTWFQRTGTSDIR